MRKDGRVAPALAAPQQKPRPLPLFLDLVKRETPGDPQRLARVLAGLRRYQEAPRPAPMPAMPVVASRHGGQVHDYGGGGPPVLFVPSLINPPSVLDLAPDRSLLRWLSGQSVRPLLLDWGGVDGRRDLDVAGHVEDVLLPLIDALGETLLLAGYCLGGTMALAAAARREVRGLALIAAPWRFAGFGESGVGLVRLWERHRAVTEALGVLPMEALQSAFWSLDPARTVAKFERLADADEDALAAFVRLEDWANDGPPLPAPAARETFERFFADDAPGSGAWIARPDQVRAPVLNIVSTADRIVPAATAAPFGERIDTDLGHVGMIVGSRAPERIWAPLAAWLSRAGATC